MRQECGSCKHWDEIEGLRGECVVVVPAWCEWLLCHYIESDGHPTDARFMESDDGMSCETFEKKP